MVLMRNIVFIVKAIPFSPPFHWESLLEIEGWLQEGDAGMLFPSGGQPGSGLADVPLGHQVTPWVIFPPEQGKREVKRGVTVEPLARTS